MERFEETISLALELLRSGEFHRAYDIVRPLSSNSQDRFEVYQIMLRAMIAAGNIPIGIPFKGNEVSQIPRTIFQFWDTVTPPPEVQVFMQGWSDENPGYEHLTFNNEAAASFIHENFGMELCKQFQRCFHPAMKSDFFRLCFAFHKGGIYVDADEYCKVPLIEWMPEGIDLVVSYSDWEKNTYIHNWFFGVTPKHLVIEKALRSALQRLWAWESGVTRPYLWDATGPGNLTRAIIDTLSQSNFEKFPSASRLCVITERELRNYLRAAELPYKTTASNWRRV